VVDDKSVEATEAIIRDFDRFFGDTEVRKVTSDDFDFVRAVLIAQLGEDRRSAGDQYKLVGLAEEKMGSCQTDALHCVSKTIERVRQ
jgi:hypothetical protein